MDKKLLATEKPELLSEWDYEKNQDICNPSTVTIGSNKKVWWICSKGHSYMQSIDNRTSRGSGCPYCSGKKVLAGYNDLETLRPDLVSEWDYEKNTDITPNGVALHSNKKVWWRCSKCGHKWQTKIEVRAYGRGCPECAKKQRIKSFRESGYLRRGINDLATLRPDLLQEWDYKKNENISPADFTCGSKEKIWWKCLICGNQWQATIANRANNNSGCPKCMKHERTSFPEQALLYYVRQLYPKAENSYTEIFYPSRRELDIYIPEIGFGIEYDGKAWHSDARSNRVGREKYDVCKAHSIKLIRVSEEENNKDSCDYYVYRDGFSDESLDNAIIDTLHFISDQAVDVDSARDRNKILKQYITVIKNKSIAIRYPKEAKEWDVEKNDGITPEMVNAASDKKFWWKCEKGHSYQSSPANRLLGNHGCPICSGRQVLPGYNDLKTKYPDVAKDWDFEKNGEKRPSEISPGSIVKYWWKCNKGHSYQATPNNKTANHVGCPFCSGNRVLSGFNDLATTNPELLEMWDYDKNTISPTSVSAGSTKKVWWRCDKNHSWEKRIIDQSKNCSCPVCGYRQVLAGENDLATTNPDLILEWDYEKNNISPSEVTKTNETFVWWKCKECGTSWKQKINVRVRVGTGCPKCGYENKRPQTNEAKIVREKRDLMSRFPEIAAEWDYEKNGDLDPAKISYGANKKVWWVCDKGHHYQAWITDRTGKLKTGCPYCSGKKIEGNLADTNPELVKEWDYDKNYPLKPEDVKKTSKEKVSWICANGHRFDAIIKNRSRKNGTNCPICGNANKGKTKQKSIVCVETGMVFNSIKEAVEFVHGHPGSITNCLKGRTKTSAGYHWRYADMDE